MEVRRQTAWEEGWWVVNELAKEGGGVGWRWWCTGETFTHRNSEYSYLLE